MFHRQIGCGVSDFIIKILLDILALNMDVKSKWNNNNKFHHKVLWTNITLITNGQHNTFILINGNDIQFGFSNARAHPLLAGNFSYKLFTLASVEPDIFIRFVEFIYFIFLMKITLIFWNYRIKFRGSNIKPITI